MLFKKQRTTKAKGTRRPQIPVADTLVQRRQVAHAAGCYAGVDLPTFTYDPGRRLATASITVYRMTGDRRCAFPAVARVEEHAPLNDATDRETMPHLWLAECAEFVALGMAFPPTTTLSGG